MRFWKRKKSADVPAVGVRKRWMWLAPLLALAVVFFIFLGLKFIQYQTRKAFPERIPRPASPPSPPPGALKATQKVSPEFVRKELKESVRKELKLLKQSGQLFSAKFGPQKPKKVKREEKKSPPPLPSPPPSPSSPLRLPERPSPERMVQEALWRYLLTQTFSGGAVVPIPDQEGKKQVQEGKQKVEKETKNALAYEPYCFVPARIVVPADSQSSLVMARQSRTACGLPQGTLFVGQGHFWPERLRARVTFTSAKLPDARLIPVQAEAYMLDETPGIGSEIRYLSRTRGALVSLKDALSAFFETLRRDQENSTCVYTDYGVVCVSERTKNRLSEALKEGASTLAKEFPVEDFFPKGGAIVLIEKGLPIKILLLPRKSREA